MSNFNFKCSAMLVLLILFGASLSGVSQTKLRSLTPDDPSQLEELGQVALSPDGRWLAYVVRRRKALSRVHARPFLEGNDRGDVWLVSVSGGTPQNLTKGEVDDSGWWSPVWSPDSERLAMLSTRGGNVRLWLWESASRRLKRLTEAGIDVLIGQPAPVVWLNEEQLACATLPKNQKPNSMTLEMRASETAIREWPRAWRGKTATVSVLESGTPKPLSKRPQGQLLLIDLLKGSRKLGTGFSFRELILSPDGRHIAVLRQTEIVRPNPDKLLTHGRLPALYEAVVYDREGVEVVLDIGKAGNVEPGSPRWSPDSRSLALLAMSASNDQQAVVCKLRSRHCQVVSGTEKAEGLTWSQESLLVLAGSQPRQLAWWGFDSAGRKVNLTENLKAPPRELITVADGNSFIGISDGDLWRISTDGSAAQNLTDQFEPRVTSFVWPRTSDDQIQGVTEVILSVRKGTSTDWILLDLASRKVAELPKPRAAAVLHAYSPQIKSAVLTASDRTGTNLWLARVPFTKFTSVVETNTHLRNIAEAEFKKIEYTSTEGQPLKGWVLLPPGYQAGTRYPLITVVYAGQVFGDESPGMARSINSTSPLNYQLLAARGYAVLFPSMPLKPPGQPSDPHLELTKGVLSAVDLVIEQGIADPRRLGLLGQSYGGYSVYGLIAQTNRFQAAVSLAGLSDLMSLYGTFDARFRYDEFAHERLFNMSLAETGQVRMGNPPWKDLERYIRNSPVAHADRIQTPVMIVQGDQDFVAMQQGEQMFSALHRQNKRATFVRYWGEGHVLQSPANVRDMWSRISQWFDSLLANGKPGSQ